MGQGRGFLLQHSTGEFQEHLESTRGTEQCVSSRRNKIRVIVSYCAVRFK
jgi:hypothetical protein